MGTQDFSFAPPNHLFAISLMYAVRPRDILLHLLLHVILIPRNSLILPLSCVFHLSMISRLVRSTSSRLGDVISMSTTYAVMIVIVRGLAPETQVDLSRYSVTIELCDSYCLGIEIGRASCRERV